MSKELIYLDPGANVYVPLYRAKLVVSATVLEVDDIYSGLDSAVWWYRNIDGTERGSTSTKEKDELGWPIPREVDKSELKNLKRVNQYLWLDEPIGHGVALGGEAFLTLEEARKEIKPSTKRKMHRRLRQYRRSIYGFVASTWAYNGEEHPGFDLPPNKRIYIRKRS